MPLKTCLHLLSSSISNKFKIKVEMLPNKILLLELIKNMVPVNSFPHAVSYISDKIHIFLIPGKYCPWLVKTHTHTLLVGTVLISVECFMTCTYPEMKSGVTNSWNPKFSMQRCLPETCVYSIIWNKTALTGHPILSLWYFTPPPCFILLHPSFCFRRITSCALWLLSGFGYQTAPGRLQWEWQQDTYSPVASP